ncbi:cytidine deaminase [Candidatus Giovannonibacteria bacterium]|nr:cytidine deaminase [Candidatus Giovannonibacteria bacterium]
MPDKILEVNSYRVTYGEISELVAGARKAREFSYAPYSHFNVGASIFAENKSGLFARIGGCNVENASYGETKCAERVAAFKAVSEGFRKFHAFAVVGGFDDSISKDIRRAAQKEYITPCGACRQVTNEFEANPCLVIIARDTGEVLITTLQYLFPCGFGPRSLGMDPARYDRHKIAI